MLREQEIPPEAPRSSLSVKRLSLAATLFISWLVERTTDSKKDTTQVERDENEAVSHDEQLFENG
jgi:hypothetical protein